MKLALPLLIALLPLAAASYAGTPVVELNPSNFQSKVKSGGVWMVEFYAPWCGHCKQLQPHWEQAAAALKGIVNVAAVDADQHSSLAGEYGIQGFPTIKMFYTDSKGKVKSVDYQAGRTAKDIINFAMDKAKALAFKRIGEKAPSGGSRPSGGAPGGAAGGGDGGFYSGTNVVTLTDDNFAEKVKNSDELWFVEFYAPWCGHCKSLKPHWEKAATQLKGKVNVGAVDCTAHQTVCSNYGVKGYPTIKFFGSNKRKPEDYQGERSSSAIVDFAKEKHAAQLPPPEVRELTSQEVLEKECTKAGKQLCFMAFLPNILDSKAAGRNKYIDILKQLADSYKDRPFAWLWAEGVQQPQLEANFDVGGFGYPAVIAFAPKDQRFSTLKGAFQLSATKEWVEAIRHGQVSVAKITGELAAVGSVNAWDGSDGQEVVEEEFSLDDIMGDDKDEL